MALLWKILTPEILSLGMPVFKPGSAFTNEPYPSLEEGTTCQTNQQSLHGISAGLFVAEVILWPGNNAMNP